MTTQMAALENMLFTGTPPTPMRHVAFVCPDFTRIQTPLLGNRPSHRACLQRSDGLIAIAGIAKPISESRRGEICDEDTLHRSCRNDSHLKHKLLPMKRYKAEAAQNKTQNRPTAENWE
ncbi:MULTISPECIES: hypothetical protein [unclassified Herbaspirillum]|uniref:hypothetical protein n=1 Tax=unclassified Herbaspirillum TaxID=2624150 RepID=UPI0016182E54|nr:MULTISPECIES: hypothetical protein [unclassified Herbaspirillum]MBB5391768.1 hypothetical protein [Herbaspirillum sp. SJZ102]